MKRKVAILQSPVCIKVIINKKERYNYGTIYE